MNLPPATLKAAADERLPYLLMKAQELIIRLHGSLHHTQREHNDHKNIESLPTNRRRQ